MRKILRSPQVTPEASPDPARSRAGLEVLMARGVRAPLAALRAVLEDAALGRVSDDPRSALHCALERLDAVGAGTELLYEFAAPRPARPLSCTLGEIARGALAGLSEGSRARVLFAAEHPERKFHVDGPLLSAALTRVLEDLLERGTLELLFHVGHDEREAWFAFLAEPQGELPQAWVPDTSPGPSETVGRMVARRDIDRMQGRVSRSWSGTSAEAVLVCMPLHAVVQAEDEDRSADERGVA